MADEDKTIKFRARRIDNGRWAYGYFVKTPITAEFNAVSGQYFDTASAEQPEWAGRYCIVQGGVAHEIDIATLGRFTGLTDKNKKEIYEGDVVNTCPIDFIGFGGGAFSVQDNSKVVAWLGDLSGAMIEVIGNIHEHPGLLWPTVKKE